MKEGVQDFIKTAGEEGCYALTLCHIAELYDGYPRQDGDAVNYIKEGIDDGYIKEDMTVLDGARFLKRLTRRHWTKEYRTAADRPPPDDYLIAEWFNKRTGKTHFTLEYPEKWNSLANSLTVKEGAIRSYRVYRPQ